MSITINDNPKAFSNWKSALNKIYSILHLLNDKGALLINDNPNNTDNWVVSTKKVFIILHKLASFEINDNPNNFKNWEEAVIRIYAILHQINNQSTPGLENIYSIRLDGIGDYLSISPLNLGTVYTLSHWFKDIGFPPLASCSIGRDNGQTLFLSSGGSQFQITNEAVSNGIFITAQVLKDACVDGNWHNIICVRRPATNGDTNYSDIEVFLDGNSIDGGINLLSNNAPLDNVIHIGRDQNQFYQYNGFIDEMAFWDNDQTANVSTISTSPIVDLAPLNPVSWWRMGDNATYPIIPNVGSLGSSAVMVGGLLPTDIIADAP